MLDSTIKTIYTLKDNYFKIRNGGADKIVAQFWSEFTGTPIEGFNDLTMTNLAKGIFMDYLKTADDPYLEVQSLLNGLPSSSPEEFRNAIWSTLALTSVKNKNDNYVNYVNGFRELDA